MNAIHKINKNDPTNQDLKRAYLCSQTEELS